MIYPKQSETVHAEILKDELCLYDWQRKEVHALNSIAAKVWQLCDGRTSPAQIATQLLSELPAELNAKQVEELVWMSLYQLEKAHLLAEPIASAHLAGPRSISRRQFLKLMGGLAGGVIVLPVVTSILAPTPVMAQSAVPILPPTGSQTFNFTGAQQTFTVPAGVTSVTIQAFGA
jgi:hypothetical protein